MPDERLTLKEMCAKFDVTPRTLRHYEYIELLQPEKVGRVRFYGAREIARLKLILRGRRFGFPLEGVRQWLLLYDADPMNRLQTEAWIEMSGRQLEELNSRLEELNATVNELQQLRAASIESLKALP
ncbi:MAG TPA: MerR family transcriptional regulator [Rhodobacteraceae bacterium]|jgi:DNA-binding transcriptional MerR regulator|nr:MerR family transcriptional regulator [Paracoccaceae bacterium]